MSEPSKEQGKREAAREKANGHQLETPASCSQARAVTSATVHYIREGELRGRPVSRAVDCRQAGRLRTLQFPELRLGPSNAQHSFSEAGGENGKSGLGVERKGFLTSFPLGLGIQKAPQEGVCLACVTPEVQLPG